MAGLRLESLLQRIELGERRAEAIRSELNRVELLHSRGRKSWYLAQTYDNGSYPSDPATVYPFRFHDASFTETAGNQSIGATARSSTSKRVGFALSSSFVAADTMCIAFRQNGKWWLLPCGVAEGIYLEFDEARSFQHLSSNTTTAAAISGGVDFSVNDFANVFGSHFKNNQALRFSSLSSMTGPVTSAVWNTTIEVHRSNSSDTTDRDAQCTLYAVDADDYDTEFGTGGYTSTQWWDMVALKTTSHVVVANTATSYWPRVQEATSLDITGPLNEVLNRPGWSAGNTVTFIIVAENEFSSPNGCGHTFEFADTTVDITL